MGGNDSNYAEYIVKDLQRKGGEGHYFIPWYVRKVCLCHILERKGFDVSDTSGGIYVKTVS